MLRYLNGPPSFPTTLLNKCSWSIPKWIKYCHSKHCWSILTVNTDRILSQWTLTKYSHNEHLKYYRSEHSKYLVLSKWTLIKYSHNKQYWSTGTLTMNTDEILSQTNTLSNYMNLNHNEMYKISVVTVICLFDIFPGSQPGRARCLEVGASQWRLSGHCPWTACTPLPRQPTWPSPPVKVSGHEYWPPAFQGISSFTCHMYWDALAIVQPLLKYFSHHPLGVPLANLHESNHIQMTNVHTKLTYYMVRMSDHGSSDKKYLSKWLKEFEIKLNQY